MIFLQGSQIEATAKCAGKCKSRKNCDGFQMYDDQSCLLLEASKLLKNEDGAVLYLKNGKTQNGSLGNGNRDHATSSKRWRLERFI